MAVLIAGLTFSTSQSPAQPTSSLTNGLLGYYPFNGNANDASGSGNIGVNYGATLTTDRFGKTNAAYFFNGNSWIDIGPVASRYDSMSISAWISTTYPNSSEGTELYPQTCRDGREHGLDCMRVLLIVVLLVLEHTS